MIDQIIVCLFNRLSEQWFLREQLLTSGNVEAIYMRTNLKTTQYANFTSHVISVLATDYIEGKSFGLLAKCDGQKALLHFHFL